MPDSLYYPRPKVEHFELHRAIHDMQENDAAFNNFMNEPEQFLANYGLNREETKLLLGHDYDGLVRYGLHPMLVVQFQRRVEWNLSMATMAED